MECGDGDGPKIFNDVGGPGGQLDHHPGAGAGVGLQGQGEGYLYPGHHSLWHLQIYLGHSLASSICDVLKFRE